MEMENLTLDSRFGIFLAFLTLTTKISILPLLLSTIILNLRPVMRVRCR